MKTLYLENSKDLPSLLDNYPDGVYWVTKKIQGYRISIKKPGVKPGCPRDIAVSIHYPNGSSKKPTHGLLVSDFRRKCEEGSELAKSIFTELKKVQERKEPNKKFKGDYPGLPVEILIGALKWVWIQEDRNYPSPKYMGRRMNWSTYLLISHGDINAMTPKGESLLKQYGYTDEEIYRIRHRSGSRHLR